MNTPFYIAKRYLFSKKSINAINFISGISMLGVFVGSAALIIILSVFNGFESIVLSMYNTFSPELRIELAEGKTFDPTDKKFRQLRADTRISSYVEVLQEKALIKYGEGQAIALVKGVGNDYPEQIQDPASAISSGRFILKEDDRYMAVIGSAIQNYLSVSLNDDFRYLEIYSPRKGAANSFNPASEFNILSIYPAGVFSAQQELDNMIIVPLNFSRKLLDEDLNVSQIEINLQEGVSISRFQKEISGLLGSEFVVKNRNQQNELLYKILNSEKWAIFLILTFVLIIAIFNIIGSLTMLVIDKRKDIAILNGLGADNRLIRSIFFIEGMMISMIGCILGMASGLLFCIMQQHFGFIKMSGVNLMIESYPIEIKASDSLLVLGTVLLVSLIASSISSRLSIKSTPNLRDSL